MVASTEPPFKLVEVVAVVAEVAIPVSGPTNSVASTLLENFPVVASTEPPFKLVEVVAVVAEVAIPVSGPTNSVASTGCNTIPII